MSTEEAPPPQEISFETEPLRLRVGDVTSKLTKL